MGTAVEGTYTLAERGALAQAVALTLDGVGRVPGLDLPPRRPPVRLMAPAHAPPVAVAVAAPPSVVPDWRVLSIVAAACLAVLNLLDVMTTHAVSSRGGIEANPVAGWLLERGLLEPAKAFLVGAIALLAARARRPERVARSLWLAVAIYAMVVANNAVHLA